MTISDLENSGKDKLKIHYLMSKKFYQMNRSISLGLTSSLALDVSDLG